MFRKILNSIRKIFTGVDAEQEKNREKRREERLLNVLRIMDDSDKMDWKIEKNRRILKETKMIYEYKRVCDPIFTDFGTIEHVSYVIDEEYHMNNPPIKKEIYKTYAFSFFIEIDSGLIIFSTDDKDVIRRGELSVFIDTDVFIAYIDEDRSDTDLRLVMEFYAFKSAWCMLDGSSKKPRS